MTDHKETAMNLLESIRLDTSEVHGQGDEDRARRMELAQIHATLYLAEQQRIANLIAIAQFSHDGQNGERIFTATSAASDWRNEAAKALGLS